MRTLSERVAKYAGSGIVVWLVVTILLVIAFSFAKGFATPENLTSVSRQGAVLALVALAQFFVVLVGHVDLSIAANAKLAALLAAIVMDGTDRNLLTGALVAILIGVAVGTLNAIVVVALKVESFIATLGTAAIVQGVALFVAPTPVGKSSPALVQFYGAQVFGGIYLVVLVVALLWGVSWLALRRTVWGGHVFAVGGDPAVAALSGVRSSRIMISSFLTSGVLGALAGLLILATSGVGDPTAAEGLQFTTLAVVVIGGASLAGGRGTLIGLLGGVVLFALLGNVFNLLHVDVWYQELLRGLIILLAAAMFVSRVAKRRRSKKKPDAERRPTREKVDA
ncbi:ABC transporter permease [Lysinimonas soli]|uniref:ABC transporter permease n=1 Tax=Lysinimonas soli TaxID=1074233 RepID=A0ABW0NU11_9MICO